MKTKKELAMTIGIAALYYIDIIEGALNILKNLWTLELSKSTINGLVNILSTLGRCLFLQKNKPKTTPPPLHPEQYSR